MEKVLHVALLESLHKRTTYLKGDEIITLAGYAKKYNVSLASIINMGRRQTIPAFREKGVWKISSNFILS